MKQKGRKSTARLSVITQAVIDRPAAPDDLTPTERELWETITAPRDPSFFDAATLPLLREYCRLVSQVDCMAEQIEKFEDDWLATDDGVKRYKALTQIRDQGQGRMIALARSMRLTQQARYVPDTGKLKPGGKRPASRLWER